MINRNHSEETGQLEGDVCNRNGCKGIIAEHETENCSCHISPPCSACTTSKEYCPECDWEAVDDETYFNDYVVRPANPKTAYVSMKPRALDHTKIDWRYEPHTHFTMKKIGVFPYGTTKDELVHAIQGTFGGRFEAYTDATPERPGTFSYIAYTD